MDFSNILGFLQNLLTSKQSMMGGQVAGPQGLSPRGGYGQNLAQQKYGTSIPGGSPLATFVNDTGILPFQNEGTV